MTFTFIDKLRKTSCEMWTDDVITHFKNEGYKGEKLNDVIKSLKNWMTLDSKFYAIYRLE